ncbi:heme ABC transporter substrate-binding protein IsdE [Priestia taiwanensis]|uniref:High-affinity heme uptake system protein IsdE n=1 Tax=Priestia taiwanensis TaxID=1347902 RepID=A0A917ARN8_9BACI|nr:heme ABC transporter substrate-binding protein IsdE [Priestia taiwanensis]MBM7363269.1 iron complex transport system substrate-binding protein [Priestia taiwanensis]GGE69042.1 heme ABC transporter substrate-binding protein IsdE [Priestia taiwanensis]
MKKWGRIITCLLVLIGVAGCAEQKESTVAGTEQKEESKERIVATTVAVTEILDALEIDNVVGIPTSYKQLPKRYDGKTVIGNPMKPDLEIVKSLSPTDVLSVTTLEYDLAPYFKEANVDATFLNLESLKNMQDAITTLGDTYNRKEQAKELVAKYDKKIEEIQKKIEGKERPSVLILLGVPGSYLVATENSYIGDLVKSLGGVNIVQGESVEYLASNTEYLQKANPDIILRAAHGMPEEVVEMFKKEFKTNDIWKHFNAVKNDRVYDLEERIFPTTANLAAEEALDVLMKMLYPE